MRSAERVVMGHEFCGEVAEGGLGTRTKPGTAVVALPLLRADDGVHLTGLTTKAPGAYAERVTVQESLAFAVPNGLPGHLAALTEPMAVALHAVHRAEVGRRQSAVVIGCGPIGLAVVAVLKATGVRHVVASDFSPGRRALAEAMGADVVVDPAVDAPYEHVGPYPSAPDMLKCSRSGRWRSGGRSRSSRGGRSSALPRPSVPCRAARWCSSASAPPASSPR